MTMAVELRMTAITGDRGVEIQCQWHQLSGAKSELGTTGLVIGNLLLSTSLKSIT